MTVKNLGELLVDAVTVMCNELQFCSYRIRKFQPSVDCSNFPNELLLFCTSGRLVRQITRIYYSNLHNT